MQSHRGLFILAGVVLVAALGIIRVQFESSPAPMAKQAQMVQPQPDITSRLLIVGDVFWGRAVQKKAEASSLGYDYLTSGLKADDRAQYDAWIGNFECPSTSRDVAYATQVASLKFNCRPEYLPALAKWFTAVSLANNHTDNNGGQQGLLETRQQLEKNGIQYAGTYNMNTTDDICEVVALPAKLKGTTRTTKLPVALCGYMQVVNVAPSDAQLAVMEAYSLVMPVIAMPHMGVEYRSTAEPEKINAYRQMIDHGASAVIGAHPHVIQNSESFRGKLIAYSVGNFMFDQQSLGRDTSIGLGVELNLEVPASKATEAYRKLAATCMAYKDNCLKQLQTAGISRPPINIKYEFRCFDMVSGVPAAGTPAVCEQARQAATVNNLSELKSQL